MSESRSKSESNLTIIVRGHLPDTRPPDCPELLTMPVGRRLAAYLVVDEPTIRRFVSRSDLDRWEMVETEAWQLALARCRLQLHFHLVRRPVGTNLTVVAISRDDISWVLTDPPTMCRMAAQGLTGPNSSDDMVVGLAVSSQMLWLASPSSGEIATADLLYSMDRMAHCWPAAPGRKLAFQPVCVPWRR